MRGSVLVLCWQEGRREVVKKENRSLLFVYISDDGEGENNYTLEHVYPHLFLLVKPSLLPVRHVKRL